LEIGESDAEEKYTVKMAAIHCKKNIQ